MVRIYERLSHEFKENKLIYSLLILIFFVSLVIRFVYFNTSVYFGYDEARDALISQEIYRNLDLKLVGPPANFPGLFHGPLFWYILGPLYILGQGDAYFVNAIFRILNSLGVFFIYFLAKYLFDKKVGLISASIYAFSFEQTQYAMYVGNPTLAIFPWMGIFYGAALVSRFKNYKGIMLMFLFAAVATQLQLILAYLFFIVFILFFLLRKTIGRVPLIIWVSSLILTAFGLFTFILAELKFNFQSTYAFFNLLQKGYNVMQPGESRLGLYVKNLNQLFHDNIFGIFPEWLILLLMITMVLYLLLMAKKDSSSLIVAIWILAGLTVLPFGGYDAYYVNVGIGLGIIIGFSYILKNIFERKTYVGFLVLVLVLSGNILLIIKK